MLQQLDAVPRTLELLRHLAAVVTREARAVRPRDFPRVRRGDLDTLVQDGVLVEVGPSEYNFSLETFREALFGAFLADKLNALGREGWLAQVAGAGAPWRGDAPALRNIWPYAVGRLVEEKQLWLLEAFREGWSGKEKAPALHTAAVVASETPEEARAAAAEK